MFFFFPFMEYPAISPATGFIVGLQPLSPLPASRSAKEAASMAGDFNGAVTYAFDFGVKMLTQSIGSYTASLTAISSRASAFFAQVAAVLAFDRMARQAASFWGLGLQAMGLPKAQPFFPGAVWPAAMFPSAFAPFTIAPAGFPFAPAAFANWRGDAGEPASAAISEMWKLWASFWTPGSWEANKSAPVTSGKPPFTATIAVPGCSWNVTFG